MCRSKYLALLRVHAQTCEAQSVTGCGARSPPMSGERCELARPRPRHRPYCHGPRVHLSTLPCLFSGSAPVRWKLEHCGEI
ncbi:hypothetical protein NDU88_001525 [Pleurodeles waltl]|uniref:Secreted protein n=1 Tax=Pleurodeles waltl TaxID=8319 RepID=A0AAV7U742_PLEWA|nr:hypothetical protein NDU88_001525 [Pleurodeles waltl]